MVVKIVSKEIVSVEKHNVYLSLLEILYFSVHPIVANMNARILIIGMNLFLIYTKVLII